MRKLFVKTRKTLLKFMAVSRETYKEFKKDPNKYLREKGCTCIRPPSGDFRPFTDKINPQDYLQHIRGFALPCCFQDDAYLSDTIMTPI